jgi:hypothetical protein
VTLQPHEQEPSIRSGFCPGPSLKMPDQLWGSHQGTTSQPAEKGRSRRGFEGHGLLKGTDFEGYGLRRVRTLVRTLSRTSKGTDFEGYGL